MSFAIDSPEVLRMEQQLQIDVVERADYYNGNAGEIRSSLYTRTCLEEYSRNYHTVSVAPTATHVDSIEYQAGNASDLRFPDVDEIDVIEDHPQLFKGGLYDQSRFMHNYHPESSPQISTFRKVPQGNKSLVDNCSYGYMKLLVSIGPKEKIRYSKQILEPIFGTACLYVMSKRGDGDLMKLTETFRFEITPPGQRRAFPHVYASSSSKTVEDSASEAIHISPIFTTSKCLFSFPVEYLHQDIFLVVELSKVLTGDPDKALLPYISPDKKGLFGGGSEPDASVLQEACKRLHKFQQPLGISVVKVFNPNGQVYQNIVTTGCSVVPHFALKSCMNEASLKQHIQDMLPPEGNSPQIRLDVTAIDVCISMHSLGTISDLSSVYPPDGLFIKADGILQSDTLQFMPSQFHTEAEAEDSGCLGRAGDKLAVRQMMTLLPFGDKSASEETIRGMRSSLDHTIFIYPQMFENFQKGSGRNLSMEVQLVEFVGVESDNLMNREYNVLNCIYNPIPGSMFVSSANTRVSYHRTCPELNDEIKIRLPLSLNRNHHLLFKVYHVHVKASDRRGSTIGGIFGGGRKPEESGELCSIIGQCFMPLLSQWSCLISDGDYAIPILEDGDDHSTAGTAHASISSVDSYATNETIGTMTTRPSSSHNGRRSSSAAVKFLAPTIIVRTRAFSSFMSNDKDLQYFLSNHPPPLGHLPSLTPQLKSALVSTSESHAWYSRDLADGPTFSSTMSDVEHGRQNTAESLLFDSTMFFTNLLVKAPGRKGDSAGLDQNTRLSLHVDDSIKVELSRHFFGMMRQFIRQLCGGDCKCQPRYANPYCHSNLRCVSFLALLRVFDAVAPHVQTGENAEGGEYCDAEFLRLYVEYVFDEETYSPESTAMNSPSKDSGPVSAAVKSAKALLKTRRSMDLVRKQQTSVINSADDLERVLEHAMAQVEEIVYQGSLLSSIGKVSHEITTGKLKSTERVAAHWWQGYVNDKSSLEEIEAALSSGVFTPRSSVDTVNPLREPLVVQPILPRYDSLEGYMSRRHQLKELLRDTDKSKDCPPMQWWPWVYEVIVYQWCAFLNVFDPRKKERIQAANVAIEEEDEEENAEDDQWATNNPYPYTMDDPILQELKSSESSMRSVATKHGSILLAMIIKSLSLRIVRSRKKAPVIMDDEFMNVLEALVSALAREVHTRGRSVLPCRRLKMALSYFLRDLFALIVPLQAARIVHAYFISSRKIQRENQDVSQKPQVDQIKTRINFIHELARMDHFFGVNFPLHIGQPYAAYVHRPVFSTKELLQRVTEPCVRGISNPPHHWLAHLIIGEIMTDYTSLEKSLREGSMRMLRELLMRLSYDVRLQSGESRHRTCAMFMPVLHIIVDFVDHFNELPSDCLERREALAIVVHVLQDTPEFLQRELWRRMTTSRVGGQMRKALAAQDSPRSQSNPNQFSGSVLGDCFSAPKNLLPIHNAVSLLNLVLDTFELPLSEGGSQGSVGGILSPGISVDDTENSTDTGDSDNKKGKTSSIVKKGQGREDMLSQLEARHNQRATKPAARAVKAGKGEERNWKKSVKHTSPRNQTGVKVSTARSAAAAKHVNHTSTMCTLKVLTAMLEEVPRAIQPVIAKYRDTLFHEHTNIFLSSVLTVLLHCLNTKQSEMALCGTLRVADTVLKQYGAQNFILFAGDTFQHWMRATLTACCSLFAALRLAATKFLFGFLLSSMQWTGSITEVAVPILAVLRDVVESLHVKCKDKAVLARDNYFLQPLHFAIKVMKENATSGKSKLYNASATLLAFLDKLDTLTQAFAFIICRLPPSATVPYDWNGANTLDAMAKSPSIFKDVDIDSVIQLLVKGAESIENLELPRLKMNILENLSRIHDIVGNPAESAMVRWNIYLICAQTKSKCVTLWAPKPPLKWVNPRSSVIGNDVPHFCQALHNSNSSPIAHPWQSESQHRKHTISTLTVAAELLKECHLVYLAERALLTLMGLHRADVDNVPQLTECYRKLSLMFTDASAGNMKFAMGTFYRVLYIGGGVPVRLRGKEYIVRNGNYLHVSEFQSLVRAHLQSLVGDGVPVSILPDTAPVPDSSTEEAFAYMTSVNPIPARGGSSDKGSLSAVDTQMLCNVAKQNEISTFQFSVPFTKEGKAHAKSIDLQWKRTTVLYVRHPFPYLTTHQEVSRREVRELTPIEVAIDDIMERISTMNDEIRKKPSTDQSYINNLMRLVQGTVVPQVNAGAAEVAKVFLSTNTSEVSIGNLKAAETPSTRADELRNQLKNALTVFLEKSKLVLEKYRLLTSPPMPSSLPVMARRATTASSSDHTSSMTGSPSPNGACSSPSNKMVLEKYGNSEDAKKEHHRRVSSGTIPPLESNQQISPTPTLTHGISSNVASELVWLTEMEKGYDALVDAIYPFITDVAVVSTNRAVTRSWSTFGADSTTF